MQAHIAGVELEKPYLAHLHLRMTDRHSVGARPGNGKLDFGAFARVRAL
jgi:hypothetical protein